MTTPGVYEWLADDFYPTPENFWPQMSPAIFHLVAYDGAELVGVYITHPINAVCWEVHHAILPSAWGARARRIGEAYEAWLWENTGAQTAVGFTPTCNRLALRYARVLGMRECGRLPRAYQRRGELFDIVIFAKGRGEAWQG